jgi:hypothetical protein
VTSIVTFVTPNFTFVKQSFSLLKFLISFPNYFLFHIIMKGGCASGIYVDTILYKERLYDNRKDDVVASNGRDRMILKFASISAISDRHI